MLVDMHVKQVAIDPRQKCFVILSSRADNRILPIPIGPAEFTAIQIQLENQQIGRPLSHDLLNNLIAAVGASLVEVVIDDHKGGTFFAKLVLNMGPARYRIDCRPSDGIALALRTDSPIRVEDRVIEQVRLRPSLWANRDKPIPSSGEDLEQFKDIVSDLDDE